MRKCVVEKLAMLGDRSLLELVIQDIDAIHNAPSEILFETAVSLFKKKWMTSKNAHMESFLEYFDKEWVKSHNGWFAFFPIKIKFASTLLELQVWRSFTRSHQRPKQFL